MKNIIAGIDFSKKTFDITVIDMRKAQDLQEAESKGVHRSFGNTVKDYKLCMAWIRETLALRSCKDVLFCGEDTGSYSLRMSFWMARKGLFMWLDSALRINNSLGIRRSKSDRADSGAIADYAARHQDKAVRFKLPDADIMNLRRLLTNRNALVKFRDALKVRSESIDETADCVRGSSMITELDAPVIAQLDRQIKRSEEIMMEIVRSNRTLWNTFLNITSIKGVALINGIAFIAFTDNFRLFGGDARKIATYWGVSPHEHTSGSSVRGKTMVSHMCSHFLKKLISEAAQSAVIHEPSFGSYYVRLTERGKNKSLAMNNVKNKIIHVITALAVHDTRYIPGYSQTRTEKITA